MWRPQFISVVFADLKTKGGLAAFSSSSSEADIIKAIVAAAKAMPHIVAKASDIIDVGTLNTFTASQRTGSPAARRRPKPRSFCGLRPCVLRPT